MTCSACLRMLVTTPCWSSPGTAPTSRRWTWAGAGSWLTTPHTPSPGTRPNWPGDKHHDAMRTSSQYPWHLVIMTHLRVDISSCNNMTDNSLRALGRGCPQVKQQSSFVCDMSSKIIHSSLWVWTSPGARWWPPRGWRPWPRAALCSTPSSPRWAHDHMSIAMHCTLSIAMHCTLSLYAGLYPHWWRGSLPAGEAMLQTPACQSPRMSQCSGWRGHGARGEQSRPQVTHTFIR